MSLLRKNSLLFAPYLEEEVKMVVFQIKQNKAPGPDGFLTEFFQSFWDTIKSNLLAMFSSLHVGQLIFFRLNFSEIILLSKVNEA
jgi:hypothetical protein